MSHQSTQRITGESKARSQSSQPPATRAGLNHVWVFPAHMQEKVLKTQRCHSSDSLLCEHCKVSNISHSSWRRSWLFSSHSFFLQSLSLNKSDPFSHNQMPTYNQPHSATAVALTDKVNNYMHENWSAYIFFWFYLFCDMSQTAVVSVRELLLILAHSDWSIRPAI